MLSDQPAMTCTDVLNALAAYYGYTAPEVQAQYPRVREVYTRTRRQDLYTTRYHFRMATQAHAPARVLDPLAQRLRMLEALPHP
jgi:hypothetical protein